MKGPVIFLWYRFCFRSIDYIVCNSLYQMSKWAYKILSSKQFVGNNLDAEAMWPHKPFLFIYINCCFIAFDIYIVMGEIHKIKDLFSSNIYCENTKHHFPVIKIMVSLNICIQPSFIFLRIKNFVMLMTYEQER